MKSHEFRSLNSKWSAFNNFLENCFSPYKSENYVNPLWAILHCKTYISLSDIQIGYK